MTRSQRRWPTPTGRPPVVAVVVPLVAVAVLGATAETAGISPPRVAAAIEGASTALRGIRLIPELSYVPRLGQELWQTLEIAVLATAVAVVVSFPLGFLAARNASPHPVVMHATRLLLSGVRGLPEMIWALVFVSALGLGPMPGVAAVAVVSVGFMAKFFAESLEAIAAGAIEGVRAHGADPLQVRLYAMLPAALPDFIGTTLYLLDHNLRSAAILGVVGAGGVGYALVMALRLCHYGRALLICAGIYLLVTLIDRLSALLRGRVI